MKVRIEPAKIPPIEVTECSKVSLGITRTDKRPSPARGNHSMIDATSARKTCKPELTVGVLGGMGPRATIQFLETVVNLTPANRDSDHIRMVVDINPTIPSRARHVLYGEASPVEAMVESCSRLAKFPVDIIVIPCNNACYFIEEMQEKIDIKIANIIEISVKKLKSDVINAQRCLVLGGRVTYERKSYEKFIRNYDMEYASPNESEQGEVDGLITSVKLNGYTKEVERRIGTLIEKIVDRQGADAVILGCTELKLSRGDVGGVCVRNSLDDLAAYVVEVAGKAGE